MSKPISVESLIWEEPPAKRMGGRPNTAWSPVVEALKARPGEWARIAEDASATLASAIKSGKLAAFRDGIYETRLRSIPGTKQRADVYVRYVGPKAAV